VITGYRDCVKTADVLWIVGQVWAHHCCAAWSEGVIQTDDYSLRFVDKAVFAGLSQVCLLLYALLCSYFNRPYYGLAFVHPYVCFHLL